MNFKQKQIKKVSAKVGEIMAFYQMTYGIPLTASIKLVEEIFNVKFPCEFK